MNGGRCRLESGGRATLLYVKMDGMPLDIARHHFAAAEEARTAAHRDMVWTDGDEAQTQALLGIGQILMEINHNLEQHLAAVWDEGFDKGYMDGDPPHPLPGPDERRNPYGKATDH